MLNGFPLPHCLKRTGSAFFQTGIFCLGAVKTHTCHVFPVTRLTGCPPWMEVKKKVPINRVPQHSHQELKAHQLETPRYGVEAALAPQGKGAPFPPSGRDCGGYGPVPDSGNTPMCKKGKEKYDRVFSPAYLLLTLSTHTPSPLWPPPLLLFLWDRGTSCI